MYQDHPRRCGALVASYSNCVVAAGSSPQVRGTSSRKACPNQPTGIIPAGAGHFTERGLGACFTGDHPRRCGALENGHGGFPFSGGSSPQVRGTCKPRTGHLRAIRIIPAGAGHLSRTRVTVQTCRDHPRRCGALPIGLVIGVIGKGSSPQVRGTWFFTPVKYEPLGIIPAGAGHFSYEMATGAARLDHPRRCGALPRLPPVILLPVGSSPQVRGT